MTYNIRLDVEDDGFNQWDNRKKGLVSLIKEENPDILGIQEGLPNQIKYLSEQLYEYSKNKKSALFLPLKEVVKYGLDIIESIEDMDLVCIDGIEIIQNKKEWEVGLFNLINNSLQTGCRLIFTSSYNHEKAIFTLPDLDSRIKKFSSYELFPIGDDYLLDALKNIAKLSSISLGDREAQYLITYTKRNMSDLVKILESLDQLSMENKRRITIPLIKELL